MDRPTEIEEWAEEAERLRAHVDFVLSEDEQVAFCDLQRAEHLERIVSACEAFVLGDTTGWTGPIPFRCSYTGDWLEEYFHSDGVEVCIFAEHARPWGPEDYAFYLLD